MPKIQKKTKSSNVLKFSFTETLRGARGDNGSSQLYRNARNLFVIRHLTQH